MLQLKNSGFSTRGREVSFLGSAAAGILHAYVSDCGELRILFANKAVERSWFYASTKLCRKAWHKARKVTKIDISYKEWKEKFAYVADVYDTTSVLKEKGMRTYNLNGGYYVARDDEYGFSRLAGNLFQKSELIEIDGELIPIEMLEEHTYVCEICGERHLKSNVRMVHTSVTDDSQVQLMCPSCAREKAFQCRDCNRFYLKELHGENDSFLCQRCRERYFVCDACGHLERRTRGAMIGEEHLCECCLSERYSGWVRDYHDNPERCFHTADGEHTNKFIGTEVETEGDEDNRAEYYQRIDVTKKHGDDETYIYQMHDGSLGNYGIECITQPMSKSFFDKFDFESWFDDLQDAGSCAPNTTGLHVHLSREWMGTDDTDEQAVLVGRMRQFLSDNQRNVEIFARRRESHWSAFKKSFDKDLKPESKDTRVEMHKSNAKRRDRYVSVNNMNENTIEFRIFAGTLSAVTYRASVEFALRVVDYICTHEENTETWEEFISYKPLPESMRTYMAIRGLKTEFTNQ